MTPLIEEALDLRARYDEEPSHSDHVALLALKLYDGLQGWHGMEPRSRELLHAAALLHDIGWSQTPDGKGHHKWSAKLVRGHDWRNLSPSEIELVAQVARYHRKAIPQADHHEFRALPLAAQKAVLILGGILRQADALDRTHTGKITDLAVEIRPEAIWVRVDPDGNWQAERAMFETKRDMLQVAAHREVRCGEME